MSAPELWNIEQFGKWLQSSPDTVRKMTNMPGFPEPIIPGLGRGKNVRKLWIAEEVVEWLRNNRKAA